MDWLKGKRLIPPDAKNLTWYELYNLANQDDEPVSVITLLRRRFSTSEVKSEQIQKQTKEDAQQDVEEPRTEMEPLTTEKLDQALPPFAAWRISNRNVLSRFVRKPKREADQVGDSTPGATSLDILNAKGLIHADAMALPWEELYEQAEQDGTIFALLDRMRSSLPMDVPVHDRLTSWTLRERGKPQADLMGLARPLFKDAQLLEAMKAKGLAHSDVEEILWKGLYQQAGNEDLLEFLRDHPINSPTSPPLGDTNTLLERPVEQTSASEAPTPGSPTTKMQVPKERTGEEPEKEQRTASFSMKLDLEVPRRLVEADKFDTDHPATELFLGFMEKAEVKVLGTSEKSEMPRALEPMHEEQRRVE
jgi:hypothetical protein